MAVLSDNYESFSQVYPINELPYPDAIMHKERVFNHKLYIDHRLIGRLLLLLPPFLLPPVAVTIVSTNFCVHFPFVRIYLKVEIS